MTDNQDHTFDQRVIELELRDGTLTDKDLRQFLKNLPDLDGQYDEVPIPHPGQRPGGSSGEAAKK